MARKVDPTKNVLALVKAAVERLDDLAATREQLAEERHRAIRREMELRARYTRLMAKAEAARLDALRGLDRSDVDRLAETTATMAATLQASAEGKASVLSAALDAYRKEQDARMSAIERFQAAGTGKGAGLDKAWLLLGGLVTFLLGLYALGSKFFGH